MRYGRAVRRLLMLKGVGVDIVYCEEKEGVVVCFLYQGHFRNQIGVLPVPHHIDELQAVKQFVEKMVTDAGLVMEADPHHEGVFHVFRI